jgi:hypothetical protein
MATFYRYVGRFGYRSVEEKRVIRVPVKPELFLALLSLMLTRATALALSFLNARTSSAYAHDALKCETGAQCRSGVSTSERTFGELVFVSCNEPAVLFSSYRPGSGEPTRPGLTLSTDPPQAPTCSSPSTFQLHPTPWFGMAIGDSWSFSGRVSIYALASGASGVDLMRNLLSAGVAQVETPYAHLARAAWPAGGNVDGEVLTPICAFFFWQESVGTTPGVPQITSSPGPLESTITTFSGPGADFLPNRGARIIIVHNMAAGLQDSTMLIGSRCVSTRSDYTSIFYDCHLMRSTSAAQARVTRAARVYFIACCNESSHGDLCERIDPNISTCMGRNEDPPGDQEPAGDDAGCFPSGSSLLLQIWGCLATSSGCAGVLCRPAWPGRPPVPPGDLCNRSARDRAEDLRSFERNRLYGGIPDHRGQPAAHVRSVLPYRLLPWACRWEQGAHWLHCLDIGGSAVCTPAHSGWHRCGQDCCASTIF